MKKLRKDQEYFVNKRDDGSSDLYSLFDFKDFRDNMDAEKAYLQGRFDAIPYIDEGFESYIFNNCTCNLIDYISYDYPQWRDSDAESVSSQ